MNDTKRLDVIISGPDGEHMPGDHECSATEQMNAAATSAANEAVQQAHEQLDSETFIEGPEHWEGWFVSVYDGDQLLFEEEVSQMLGELGYRRMIDDA